MDAIAMILGAMLIGWQATLNEPSALALIGGLALMGYGLFQSLGGPRRQASALRSTAEENMPVLRDIGAPMAPAIWPTTAAPVPVATPAIVSDEERDATWQALVGTLQDHAGAAIVRKTSFSFGGTGPVLELEARGRLFYLWPARDPQGQAVIVATEAMPQEFSGDTTFITAAVIGTGSRPVSVRVGTTVTAEYPADASALDAIHQHLCRTAG